jgi:hypothetical protein
VLSEHVESVILKELQKAKSLNRANKSKATSSPDGLDMDEDLLSDFIFISKSDLADTKPVDDDKEDLKNRRIADDEDEDDACTSEQPREKFLNFEWLTELLFFIGHAASERKIQNHRLIYTKSGANTDLFFKHSIYLNDFLSQCSLGFGYSTDEETSEISIDFVRILDSVTYYKVCNYIVNILRSKFLIA